MDWLAPSDSTSIVALAERVVCPDCLHAERLTTLGDTAGEGYVEATRRVARDSVGRYWLTQGDRLKVFDANGAYLREVGRPGKGPMEFSLPRQVYTDVEGNIHVLDPDNVRETIISPEFQSVGERPFPVRGSVNAAAPLPGGHRYVVNMWVPTADGIAAPLHVIDGARILSSFGRDSSSRESQNEFTLLRLLATDDAGRIISVKRFDYDIEVWTDAGRHIVGFAGPKLNTREVRWGFYNFDDNPLPSEIKDIESDGRDRLWVLIWHVKPDWQRHFVRHVYPNGMVGLQLRRGSEMDSVYSSRIDVIDLHRGALIARLVHEGLLTGFVGRGLVFQNLSLPDGTPRIAIWQVRLEQPES